MIGKGDKKRQKVLILVGKKGQGEGSENGEVLILPCWYIVEGKRCISFSIFL